MKQAPLQYQYFSLPVLTQQSGQCCQALVTVFQFADQQKAAAAGSFSL